MKKHVPRLKKKGAIQMSMQTIIVVVIGVTLLTLGLKFVYDTFTGIGGQQEKVTKLTEKQITELYGESEEPIYLPRDTLELKQGKSDSIDVIIRNVEPGTINPKLKLMIDEENLPEAASAEEMKGWFTYRKSAQSLDEGEAATYKVTLDVPKTAKLGTYLVTFEVDCADTSGVCGSIADLVVKVKA